MVSLINTNRCRCAEADDLAPDTGVPKVVCNSPEVYVVKEASPSEGWLTDEWCASYCDVPGGCTEEAAEKCKCGSPPAEVTDVDMPGEADAADSEDMLICPNDQYVAANEASTDLWCADSCVPDGCPKDAQEACKCDDDPHGLNGEGPLTEGDMQEVGACLSVSEEKTNDWCNSECGQTNDCPSDARQYCRCGEEAVTDEALDQAQKAQVARDTAANVQRATTSAKSACLARNRVGEDCEAF